MALQATYQGVNPITVKAGATAIVRGVRVTRQADGTVAVQDHTARGDYTTLTSIEASKTGEAARNTGCKVPALANGAVAIGDLAYSADSGKFSNTSGGGAVLMGRWTMAASSDGILGEVELFTVA